MPAWHALEMRTLFRGRHVHVLSSAGSVVRQHKRPALFWIHPRTPGMYASSKRDSLMPAQDLHVPGFSGDVVRMIQPNQPKALDTLDHPKP